MFYFKLVWILVLVAYCPHLPAVTLEEIKSLARDHSAALKAKEQEAMALASEQQLRGKWQNPQLMGQIGTLKSGDISGTTAEFTLTQAVPLSDKFTLRRNLAEIALSTHQEQQAYYLLWVQHQAVLSAWRVMIAQELLQHGVERAERMQLIEQYLATHPKVSVRQKVEQSIISSLLLQLKQMQEFKKQELKQQELNLAFWTGQNISAANLILNFPLEEQTPLPVDQSLEKNLELKEAKLQLAVSRLDSELAAKERRPDFFLGGGYRTEQVEPINHFSYAIVGLNIPIWDTGHHRLESAKARAKRDEKNLEETIRRTELRHKQQLELVRHHFLLLKKFPIKLKKSQEQAIKLAQEGFKQGLLDVNTFLQSETQTHEVLDMIYLNWLSYLEELSTLQLMRGEEFVWEKK